MRKLEDDLEWHGANVNLQKLRTELTEIEATIHAVHNRLTVDEAAMGDESIAGLVVGGPVATATVRVTRNRTVDERALDEHRRRREILKAAIRQQEVVLNGLALAFSQRMAVERFSAYGNVIARIAQHAQAIIDLAAQERAERGAMEDAGIQLVAPLRNMAVGDGMTHFLRQYIGEAREMGVYPVPVAAG